MLKKIFLVAVFLLVACVAMAAGPGMKTFEFGPYKYQISELAPDFYKWTFKIEKEVKITGPPTSCTMFLLVGANSDKSVKVMLLIIKEPSTNYLAGVLVKYEANGKKECYEDTKYWTGGPPSFILTKKSESGDVLILIEMKKIQFGKKEI